MLKTNIYLQHLNTSYVPIVIKKKFVNHIIAILNTDVIRAKKCFHLKYIDRANQITNHIAANHVIINETDTYLMFLKDNSIEINNLDDNLNSLNIVKLERSWQLLIKLPDLMTQLEFNVGTQHRSSVRNSLMIYLALIFNSIIYF